jgi:hypothetical protein
MQRSNRTSGGEGEVDTRTPQQKQRAARRNMKKLPTWMKDASLLPKVPPRRP